MTKRTPAEQAYLERMYDGPIPPNAGAPASVNDSRSSQYRSKRLICWKQVRKDGHFVVQSSRALRIRRTMENLNQWKKDRWALARSLNFWAHWRNGEQYYLERGQ